MVTEQTICEFLRQSVEEIRNLVPVEQHSWQNARIEREATSLRFTGSSRPDFRTLITLQHQRRPLSAITELSRHLEADGRYPQIRDESARPRDGVCFWSIQPEQIAFQLIHDYLRLLERLEFAGPQAAEIAKEFLHALNTGVSVAICYTGLRGLEMDFEKYQLAPDLQMRKLTDEETLKYFYSSTDRSFRPEHILHPVVIEFRSESSAGQYPADLLQRARGRFDEVRTALHLIKPGRVEYEALWVRRERLGQFPIAEFRMGSMSDSFRPPWPLAAYSLSTLDLPLIEKTLSALKLAAQHDRLSNAINRVNFAATRQRLLDRLLDLMIALEALYGDESGAIGYKIGMRCATFTEQTVESREQTNALVGRFFKQRHRIVHGRTSNIKEISDEGASQLLMVVQKSIGLFLDQLLLLGRIPESKDFDRLLLE